MRLPVLRAAPSPSVWRWASIVLATAIALARPDLPTGPVFVLTLYFVLTYLLVHGLHLKVRPGVMALLDVTAVSITVLFGGGENSPVYIIYVAILLEAGLRISPARHRGLGHSLRRRLHAGSLGRWSHWALSLRRCGRRYAFIFVCGCRPHQYQPEPGGQD